MNATQLYEARFAAAAGGGPSGRDEVAKALLAAATRLQAQASSLLSLGFEGALDAVVSVNATGKVPFRNGYAKLPPCCALQVVPEAEARRGCPYSCAPGGEATLPADYKYPAALL